jgi:hypothetical protein
MMLISVISMNIKAQDTIRKELINTQTIDNVLGDKYTDTPYRSFLNKNGGRFIVVEDYKYILRCDNI